MVAIYKNNARSTLAADASNSDLTITVQTGDASKFPSPGAGEWAAIIVAKADGSQEIMHCTGRTGAILTVSRAQEGTTALGFSTGDAVIHAITAAGMDEKWDDAKVGAAAAKTTPVDADTILLRDSAASNALKLLSWANLKTGIGTALGALIAAATGKTTPVDGDTLVLSDSADSAATKKLTWANVKATLKTYFDTLYVAAGTAPPAGAVMPFAQSSAPTGWLKCNGAAVSRTTYATLFAAIGTTYGAGDGSTTFNLPDLRGEFVRGLDDGRGIDAARALGSAQADANKSHSHTGSAQSAGAHTHTGSAQSGGAHTHGGTTASNGAHTHTVPSGTNPVGSNTGQVGYTDSNPSTVSTSSSGAHTHTFTTDSGGAHTHTLTVDSGGAHTHTLSIDADGGAEARPRNVALLYCIKT